MIDKVIVYFMWEELGLEKHLKFKQWLNDMERRHDVHDFYVVRHEHVFENIKTAMGSTYEIYYNRSLETIVRGFLKNL